MKTETIIESSISEFKLGYISDGFFTEIDGIDKEEMRETAAKLKTSPELLLALSDMFREFRLLLHRDLADIWQRLGQAGIE
jgi:hypothetical protein